MAQAIVSEIKTDVMMATSNPANDTFSCGVITVSHAQQAMPRYEEHRDGRDETQPGEDAHAGRVDSGDAHRLERERVGEGQDPGADEEHRARARDKARLSQLLHITVSVCRRPESR